MLTRNLISMARMLLRTKSSHSTKYFQKVGTSCRLLFLCYNIFIYLSKEERKDIIEAYGLDNFIEESHYQVEPDTWVYLFAKEDKHYVLISADFLDFYYDHFPTLLRFNNFEFQQIDFMLQKKVNSINPEKTSGTICFEYNKQ